MSQRQRNSENIRLWPWMIGSVVLILALWLGCWLFAGFHFSKIEQRGQFGDMFGAINALFSGFAFAGIIWAIILQKNELSLQREELKLQRDELEQTRKEIKGQKEQLQAQDQTLKKQNFEDTFFQLLRFHVDIVGSLKFRSSTGSDCFCATYGGLAKLA